MIRKLASTATNPHFDSLEFIESAGAWSPEGKSFVLGAVHRGHASLVVIDPETGDHVKEVDFPELSEIEIPSFAPDGHRVVFSAQQGGYLDLWLYDLQGGKSKRLTNDAYAELHPVFSPDGNRIAYTTDRFGTDLHTLAFGNYRLALLDLASGEVTALAGYKDARNSNPRWSPDGESLYFLSDADGAANVHRLDLATGQLRQVTELRTGAAGITPLSPALDVAAGTGRVAYSVFRDSKYRIYAIDDEAKRQGEPSVSASLDEERIVLPPREQAGAASKRCWLRSRSTCRRCRPSPASRTTRTCTSRPWGHRRGGRPLRGDNVTSSECRPSASSQCALYDRLFGSRALLASAELRAPLVGLFKGRLEYGPIPVELAHFADAGVAWTSAEKASFLGGDRGFLTSVGAAARVNVLGFLVAEVSAARPLSRPDFHGWVWQWSFSPGF